MKQLIYSLLFFTCAFCPVAVLAAPVFGADGVFRYVYGERTPPTLACVPLFVCDLALERGETISNVAVGDSVRWLIAPASSGAADSMTAHLLINTTMSSAKLFGNRAGRMMIYAFARWATMEPQYEL